LVGHPKVQDATAEERLQTIWFGTPPGLLTFVVAVKLTLKLQGGGRSSGTGGTQASCTCLMCHGELNR